MAKRVDIADITCPSGASAAVSSNKISNVTGVHQGTFVAFKVTAADITANRTFTFEILDLEGDVIYSVGSLTKGAQTFTKGLSIPLCYGEKVAILPSGDPGEAWLFSGIAIFYEPDPYFRI